MHTDRGDVTADHYVAALPVEVMRQFLTPELIEADPRLAGLERLQTDWMVGFQFYLAERLPELPPGHWGFGNTPFKISGIQQTDFWPDAVRLAQLSAPCEAIVSVIVSDVDTPGILFGKPARLCTATEIEQELWAQMDMGATGTPFEAAFSRSSYLGFAVAPDVGLTGDNSAHHESPLFINHCGALWS